MSSLRAAFGRVCDRKKKRQSSRLKAKAKAAAPHLLEMNHFEVILEE